MLRNTIFVAVLLCGVGVLAPDSVAQAPVEAESGSEIKVPLEALSDHLPPEQVIAVAKRLIAAGQLDAARRLLESAESGALDETEVQFLQGSIATMEKRYGDAIALFRKILVNRPGLTRIRLELARALFLSKDDEAAEYHFRLALADQPPGPVAQNIWRFLDAIRARQTWRYSLSAAIAPDSNINVAPEDERVDLFGIPFILDESARKTSGLGVVASGSVDYTPHLFGRTKLDTGVFAQHTEYKGADFDDTYISGHIGPSFYWPRTSLSFRPTASYRWFGNARYNRAIGLRTHLGRHLSRKWSLNATLSYDHVNYFVSDDLDGPVYAGLLVLNYGLSSRSFLRGIFGISREDARATPLRNTEWRFGAGYHRDFAWGIRAYLQPEITYTPYEGVQPAFGQKRTDWQTRIGLSIIKRDIAFLGLSPELRYTFIRNDSSIDFFSYTRHRVEVGFTRRF